MMRKGYTSIKDFRGKLREFDAKRATKTKKVTKSHGAEDESTLAPMSSTALVGGVIVLLLSLLLRAHHLLGTFS
jgi:hypothetical protein